MIDFTKMHGAGNDFVVIADLEDRYEIDSEAARLICNRRFGIGADGVVRICSGRQSEFFMDYRNADGSVPETGGNSIRVVAKWLGERGFADEVLKLETHDGVKPLSLTRRADKTVETVTVDMGSPIIGSKLMEEIVRGGQAFRITEVSMGNPHAVIFVDDVEKVPLDVVGPLIQSDEDRFPNGINVEVAMVLPGANVKVRTFERGSGETFADGTGACAVVVAGRVRGLLPDRVHVQLKGGGLEIHWPDGGSVAMTGTASESFQGAFDPAAYGVKFAH